MSKPEWSLIDYRKKQQLREFELSGTVTVIARSPSNEEEVKNTMRRHRAQREIEEAQKLDNEIADLIKNGRDEDAEKKATELQGLRDKGLDWLVENLRTQVADPDGKRIPFNTLRKCFGDQDEVIALMNAMGAVEDEGNPQMSANGSQN